jgi:tetratricopeptide (TPR) repeat protein
LFAQNSIDSLKLALKNAKHDSSRCNILSALAETAEENEWPEFNEQLFNLSKKNSEVKGSLQKFYLQHLAASTANKGFLINMQGDHVSCVEFYKKSIKLYEQIDNKQGIADCLYNIAIVYDDTYDPRGFEFHLKSLKLFEEIGDKNGIAKSLNNIGVIFYNQGNITKTLEYYYKSLKILEEIGDKIEMARTLSNIGVVYQKQNDLSKALDNYNKSLKIFEAEGEQAGIITSLNNIGNIYFDQGDLPKSLEYHQKTLKLCEQSGNDLSGLKALMNIGNIYQKQGDTKKALEYILQGLKIAEKLNAKEPITYSLFFISNLLLQENRVSEAYPYANRNLKLSKELGYPKNILNAATALKEIFKKQNKYKEAFEMYGLEIKMRDSINNQETQKAAVKKQMQYEYEKKEAIAVTEHKSELSKQQAVAAERGRRQDIVIWFVVIGLLLVTTFCILIFRSLRITRKQKLLIEIKNKETEAQKHEIEEKQKEIIDSITYARRIQRALITNDKYIEKSLNKLQAKKD